MCLALPGPPRQGLQHVDSDERLDTSIGTQTLLRLSHRPVKDSRLPYTPKYANVERGCDPTRE